VESSQGTSLARVERSSLDGASAVCLLNSPHENEPTTGASIPSVSERYHRLDRDPRR